VIFSVFDSVSSDILRIAVERLVQDGRIHATWVEEMVAKARRDVDEHTREIGEDTASEVNGQRSHPAIITTLSRPTYPTSYGHNVLKHSTEVAYLAGLLAAELGEDVSLARRAGLLHDIGKAIDHEVEGSHVEIGKELAMKYKEHEVVINSIASHH